MPQGSNDNLSASIYALISICTWFATITIQDLQIAVSIMGGLVAIISGGVSIYKNIKK